MKTKLSSSPFSIGAIAFIIVITLGFRLYNSDLNPNKTLNVLTWDALGYYLYLPATFIYEDITELKWYPAIEAEYGASGGGNLYQANLQESGNYVFKYLGGVAIMESPFFFTAHIFAKNTSFPADGFSKPYQYGIAFGAIFYAILALILLRKILLRFFDDRTTALTLLLLTLASNWVQYIAVDGALSHSYIFPLYVLIIYLTMVWHDQPKLYLAMVIGFVIGLATICRPTELIMVFIPLFWNTHTREETKQKWSLVTRHKGHVIAAMVFGLIGILPQLLYWFHSTGDLIYNVGSKWSFLSPFFRVLFGWEKGWFIYTPVTVFFVAGLFFSRSYPFKKSVSIFCLLNIWIIISWFHWRYGASYSTRALVQSYPVFALGLGALISRVFRKKWQPYLLVIALTLIFINLFQTWQYDEDILHSDHMNRQYYGKIFLNPRPSALEMSLLDTRDWVKKEDRLTRETIYQSASEFSWQSPVKIHLIDHLPNTDSREHWLKFRLELKTDGIPAGGFIKTSVDNGLTQPLMSRIRLNRPLYKPGNWNDYSFYVKLPPDTDKSILNVHLEGSGTDKVDCRNFYIEYLF
ncbi:MAG: hypothetical protein DWQ02_19685 [Bacteroidetes bacterium]|nr:MAG: hypothetical protein DWQ02_19685 [Bacteroidota bacterium]